MREKFEEMKPEYSQKYLQIKSGINRGRVGNVVFNTDQAPFFSVAPELSDLGENLSVAQDFTQQYPKIFFDKACLVDGAVLIQDINARSCLNSAKKPKELARQAQELNKFSKITLQVVNGLELTQSLLKFFSNPKNRISLEDALIVFPGNGAQVVSDYMRTLLPQFNPRNAVYLPTERTMIKPGNFNLNIDCSTLPKNTVSRTAVIIDDVVASGQTGQRVAFLLKSRFGIKKVLMATWLFAYPSSPENKEASSGIEGVDQTFTSIVLKGNYMTRPPINSLSCFFRDEQKYQNMKESYLLKYVKNPTEFLMTLERMKKLARKGEKV